MGHRSIAVARPCTQAILSASAGVTGRGALQCVSPWNIDVVFALVMFLYHTENDGTGKLSRFMGWYTLEESLSKSKVSQSPTRCSTRAPIGLLHVTNVTISRVTQRVSDLLPRNVRRIAEQAALSLTDLDIVTLSAQVTTPLLPRVLPSPRDGGG